MPYALNWESPLERRRQIQSLPMTEESEATRLRAWDSEQPNERARVFPQRRRYNLRRQIERARATLAENGGIAGIILFPFSLVFWIATLIILAVFASGLEAD